MNKVTLLTQNRQVSVVSLDGLLAEPGDEASHLQLARRALHDTHVRHSYLLDKLQLQVFRHRVCLANAKNVGDDVLGGVTEAPKTAHDRPEKRGKKNYVLSRHIFFQLGVATFLSYAFIPAPPRN